MGALNFRYPIIILLFFVLILLIIIAAVFLPRKLGNRVPVVYSDRLTALSGYRQLRRRLTIINIATIISLGTFIFLLTLIAARPSKHYVLKGNDPYERKTEIMLCTNKKLDDIYTQTFLQNFVAPANNEKNMIGLTSQTTRVLPLSNQFWFSSEQLAFFATTSLHKIENNIAVTHPHHKKSQKPPTISASDNENYFLAQNLYERKIGYTDYLPNYLDTIALCLAGFPAMETEKSPVDRSVLFFGDPIIHSESKKIFSAQELLAIAARAHASINMAEFDKPTSMTTKIYHSLTQETHGSIIDCYNPDQKKNTHIDLSQARELITPKITSIYPDLDSTPTNLSATRSHIVHTGTVDNPQILLAIATFGALLLSIGCLWIKK